MIYKLRQKFIKICIISFVTVFILLLFSIYLVTTMQTNRQLDMLADVLSENDGRFPEWNNFEGRPNRPMIPDGMNKETPFTTRFFTVRFDKSGNLISADIAFIASVTKEEAIDYAEDAISKRGERGWMGNLRYKVYNTDRGQAVIFVNGLDARESNREFMLAASTVFVISSFVIIVLIILISKHAVKPASESYEKQKRFITDANHELKTPLTLIRTNLDIMEKEIGTNEWLTDIKEESKIMTELVNRLVTLARMDEDGTKLEKEPFPLSEAVLDTVYTFASHIEKEQKKLLVNIPEGIRYNGNEGAIRQLVSILFDNAVKYCDDKGVIGIALYGGKRPTIIVDNSYSAVASISLDKLFDRFYRADTARTYGNGFGIGLSIAKGIVEKHHGTIRAINLGNNVIRFQVSL